MDNPSSEVVQCYRCQHWNPERGEPKLVKLGYAVCDALSVSNGHTFSGIKPHVCAKYSAAAPDTADGRMAFLISKGLIGG